MITLDTYEEFVKNTAIYPDKETDLTYPALGLSGEAGEYCNKVKKVIRDKNNEVDEETRKAMLNELGDVIWYVARNAQVLGSSLNELMQINFYKLADRQIRGELQGDGDDR